METNWHAFLLFHQTVSQVQEATTKSERTPYHGLKPEHHLIKEGGRGIDQALLSTSIRQCQSVPYYAAAGYGGAKSRCIELGPQAGTAER